MDYPAIREDSILRGPRSSSFWVPPHLSHHIVRQARTGDIVLAKSREMRHRTLYIGFSLSWPVNRLCGILFNTFYRLEIHSLMVGIFEPACELLPPWTKELYLCTVAPLHSLWPPPPSPLPKLNVQYSICRQCVSVEGGGGRGGGGGVELHFRPYSAGVLQSVSHQIQNLQNCFTTPNKNDQ